MHEARIPWGNRKLALPGIPEGNGEEIQLGLYELRYFLHFPGILLSYFPSTHSQAPAGPCYSRFLQQFSMMWRFSALSSRSNVSGGSTGCTVLLRLLRA